MILLVRDADVRQGHDKTVRGAGRFGGDPRECGSGEVRLNLVHKVVISDSFGYIPEGTRTPAMAPDNRSKLIGSRKYVPLPAPQGNSGVVVVEGLFAQADQ